MICPKCGSEITEDTDFCGICGMRLADFDEPSQNDREAKNEQARSRIDHSSSRADKRKSRRQKFLSRVKLIIGIMAVIAVVVAAVIIISSLKKSEGERIFENVPLGRTVDIVDKDTGVTFDVSSGYPILPQIAPFGYVKESDGGVKVEGVHLPEWAVLLSKNAQNNIDKVSYYEFAVLKSSWKGQTLSEKLDTGVIKYGQKIRDVERAVGIAPYAMIATLDNNTTECVFRYNAPDENGNSHVYNLSVYIDDADDTVKDVVEAECDYIGFFLAVK
jgi:hypothetical protein